MGDLTKDEIRAELDELGIEQPPTSATRDELLAALDRGRDQPDDEDFTALPGDSVIYQLTADDAFALTAREARFARFVKHVAPFEPRKYSEGDAVPGRVFSSYDDGTADVDLSDSFPRVTLDRVLQGDEPGTWRKRD